MKTFEKEKLEFHLPETFKGLVKSYIIDCVFNIQIQFKWKPEVGDIIVNAAGNIFVIGGECELNEKIGGKLFLFGGNLCSRSGGSGITNETSCGTMNKDGKFYELLEGNSVKDSFSHSSFSDFRFVPYPHETERR